VLQAIAFQIAFASIETTATLTFSGPPERGFVLPQVQSADAGPQIAESTRAAIGQFTDLRCEYRRSTGNVMTDEGRYEFWIGFPFKILETERRTYPSGGSMDRRTGFNGERLMTSGIPINLTPMMRKGLEVRERQMFERLALLFAMSCAECFQVRLTNEAVDPIGHPSYVVETADRNTHIYIDKARHLINAVTIHGLTKRRVSGRAAGRGDVHEEPSETTIFVSDYKPLKGVQIPRRITVQSDETVEDDWTIDSCEVNVGGLDKALQK
jgi:hypothetical protein